MSTFALLVFVSILCIDEFLGWDLVSVPAMSEFADELHH
jgi:hypothetical protein